MRKTFIVAILGFALLSGCRPTSLWFVTPEGPAEYQRGGQDGCDSGLSAQGNYLYRAIYGFKKRPEMAENELYKSGWNEGFQYCRFSEAAQNK